MVCSVMLTQTTGIWGVSFKPNDRLNDQLGSALSKASSDVVFAVLFWCSHQLRLPGPVAWRVLVPHCSQPGPFGQIHSGSSTVRVAGWTGALGASKPLVQAQLTTIPKKHSKNNIGTPN